MSILFKLLLVKEFVKLGSDFFSRRADIVARELLGKVLVRRLGGKEIRTRIVEVEAYLSGGDETSSENKKLSKKFGLMWGEEGVIFTYLVHNYDMLCIVTEKNGVPECVFIRALEPLNSELRLNGPGILTKNLKIDRIFNGKSVDELDDLWIENSEQNFEIVETTRVGTKEKNPKELRFYIKGNKFVSRE